ncbi:unnamed protein product [Paramecium primaurelia]|uniref:Protein kinase domain-containing protein n=1 Tax=Paramecium primaurelia TaxID=5886 RepID=A0A8S1LSZ6_PARPR|nr:unnamed protein product [Paramecium primaurelia]
MLQQKKQQIAHLNPILWQPLEKLQLNHLSQHLIYSGIIWIRSDDQQLHEEQVSLYADRLQIQQLFCNLSQTIIRRNIQTIKLVQGKNNTEIFFNRSADLDNWFNMLKRYTIQLNFSKDYKLNKRLGYQDPQTQIYQARCFANNINYTVKVIQKNNKFDPKQIQQEINILRRIKHKNIINLVEVYEDQYTIFLVFDNYFGTEMVYRFEDLLNSQEPQYARIIYKLLEILSCIHSLGIIHGDIKLENIYVKSDNLMDICLANFNQAEFIDNQEKGIKGSEGYQSPELLNGKPYDQSIDIYAVGIIFYYFIYQVMPFSESQEHNDNKTGQIEFPQVRNTSYAIDLLKQMLQVEPKQRIKPNIAMNHEWFIKMKVQEKLFKQKSFKDFTLPTILEKSDIFTQSPGQQPKRESIGVFEDEFLLDSLSDRMGLLKNAFNPSKMNHDIFQKKQK